MQTNTRLKDQHPSDSTTAIYPLCRQCRAVVERIPGGWVRQRWAGSHRWPAHSLSPGPETHTHMGVRHTQQPGPIVIGQVIPLMCGTSSWDNRYKTNTYNNQGWQNQLSVLSESYICCSGQVIFYSWLVRGQVEKNLISGCLKNTMLFPKVAANTNTRRYL